MIPVYPATLPTPAASAVTPAERRFLSHSRYPTEARTFERYRRTFERVTWPWMNATKAEAWNDWWTNDIGYGGSWFKSTWPSPRGQVETDRHFISTPTWRFRGGGFWQVSALIETRTRGSLPTYPIAGHRYWRLTNITVPTGDWQPTELQLWEDASTRADNASTTITTDAAIVFGTIGRLVDSDVSTTFVEFFPWNTSKVLVWDFGASVEKPVSGFKHADRAGGGTGNAMSTARLEWSDDNLAWTTYGDATGFAYSPDALSAFVPAI